MSRLAALAALVARIARPETAAPEAALALARAAAGPRRAFTLGFVNAHALNLCAASPTAAAAFGAADLLLRDGVGMAALMRLAGRDPGPDVNGTDLIPRLAAGRRVALYGGAPGVAQAAAETLRARFGATVVAARHGYHAPAAYARWLAADAAPEGGAAELVILGLGMPRQEALARRLRAAAPAPVGLICGGAALDFLAGRTPRAPLALRRAGLEWAFRLALEPGRLGRRYLLGNPLFLARAPLLAAELRRGPAAPAALAAPRAGSDRQRPAIAA